MTASSTVPRGVVLWSGGLSGPLQGSDPQGLAADHPAWREAVDLLSPWRSVTTPDGLAWWEPGCPETSSPESEATVILCRACPSTQDAARWLLERDLLESGGTILAASQSAGRGRRGRPWASAAGNVHGTWVQAAGVDPAVGALASLAAGLVVATALDDLGLSSEIKWPNDVLVAGRKVAGILIESWGPWTLTGIGVNVFWCPADAVLRLEGSVAATTLQEQGARQSPLAVWLAILRRGRDELGRWLAAREARDLCEAIEGRLAWLGDDVVVHESPEEPGAFECRILGLNADGSLRVRRQGRVTALHSGRLSSLRR